MNMNKEISFESNFLTVDGKKLRTDVLPSRSKDKLTVSPEELQQILAASRERILSTMETIYAETKKPGLTVSRPSIWTAQLGLQHQSEGAGNKVFTTPGQRNGGVITEADEIHEGFHEHFAVIGDAGFMPEVRRTAGARKDSGSWLLLRKPTLREVARHWLGHGVSAADAIDASRGTSSEELRAEDIDEQYIRSYRLLGEVAVDNFSDDAGDRARSGYQIGLLLAVAALKHTMGDQDGYAQEIDDAFLYADNDPTIHESAVRAIENSVYRTQR